MSLVCVNVIGILVRVNLAQFEVAFGSKNSLLLILCECVGNHCLFSLLIYLFI